MQFEHRLLSALDQYELFSSNKQLSPALTFIFHTVCSPTAYWITCSMKHQTAAFFLSSYRRRQRRVQTQAQGQLLYIHSFPLSSLVFPQHSLTTLNTQPKMKRLTPRSLGSPCIFRASCSSINIWGRKAGPRKCWGPLPRLCRLHPAAPRPKPVVLTHLCL